MKSCCGIHAPANSRRDFLTKSAFGFGAIAADYLLGRETAFAAPPAPSVNPLAPKPQDFPAKAKSVIFVFLQGGPSHVDTFDPKPNLQRFDGKPFPPSFKLDGLSFTNVNAAESTLMGSAFPFNRYGESGLEISDLFRNVARHADDLAIVRSCYHDVLVHGPALNFLYLGSVLGGHPSIGAWVLYGLGSESQNVPAYMVMTDGGLGGRLNKNHFGSGFLPAIYQGTLLRSSGSPILNLDRPADINEQEQRAMLDALGKWDRKYSDERPEDTRLEARISNYELAFRMQMAAPDLIDISTEPESVRKMYGLGEEKTDKFGKMCLLSRRMVERGVRFVQLVSADWDGHGECDDNHRGNAERIDLPIAGLLEDLKQHGLLDSTLVVCVGEFGRTPFMQGKRGRDHHPYGFSFWMAGGGIRGGKTIGATDDLGMRAVEDKVHVHDLHATMLSLLGLDFKDLTYRFQGRDRRLTDIGGQNDLSQRLIQA